jgi:hypothetical protein
VIFANDDDVDGLGRAGRFARSEPNMNRLYVSVHWVYGFCTIVTQSRSLISQSITF